MVIVKYIVLPLLAVILLLAGLAWSNATEKRNKALEAVEREKAARLHRKTKGRQDTLLGTLLNALNTAAKKNEICNVLPSGAIASGVSSIMIGKICPKPQVYSLLVYLADQGSVRSVTPIYQIDIDLFQEDESRCIRVHHCPYGPDRYFSEGEFYYVLTMYAEAVQYHSHFPETRRKHLAELGIALAIDTYQPKA